MSRWLDRELGRFFTKDAAAVARDFYSPQSQDALFIGDLVSATSVLVDEAGTGTPLVAYTGYQLDPLNAADGPEPTPFTRLVLPGWASHSQWTYGQLVRVTGIWGWPAVPKAIERATIHLTAILRLETARSQSTVQEMGGIVQTSPQARGIVERLAQQYSRKVLFV